MKGRSLLDLMKSIPEFEDLLRASAARGKAQLVYGLSGSARTFLAAGLASGRRQTLIVTEDLTRARRVAEEIEVWYDGRVRLLPPLETLPYEVMAMSGEVREARISALMGIMSGETGVLVAPAEALTIALMPPTYWQSREIRVGDLVPLEEMAALLADYGYERVDMVEGVGQFSIRGGIVDFYAPRLERPVRIDLFGDEVDSIRSFDPLTQRSEENLGSVKVAPVREFLLDPGARERGIAVLERAIEKVRRSFERSGEPLPPALAKHEEHLALLREGGYFEGFDAYLPYFYPQLSTVLDYFRDPPLVLIDEPGRTAETLARRDKFERERQRNLLQAGKMLPGQEGAYMRSDDLLKRLAAESVVGLSLLMRQMPGFSASGYFSFTAKGVTGYQGNLDDLVRDLNRWRLNGYRVAIYLSTSQRTGRVRENLRKEGLDVAVPSDSSAVPNPAEIFLVQGYVEEGFEFPGLKLIVLVEGNLFQKARRRSRRPSREGPRLTYTDLKPGDYVVHVNHGIGRYDGLRVLDIEGVQRELLMITYAGGDRLYVPVDQLDLIQKYIGGEGEAPHLNKLGGNEWNRTKSRVKESVREMADDLLKLYAAREATVGHAFAPDSPWQREFEQGFPYEETPDQIRAVEEIKADMEKPQPMDRLLCGDVGYGKTEVAIRAAFKAVMDGKQVAVLVPTTILAQQHFRTFSERFAGYPFTIELLSRFRTPAENRKALRKLAAGKADIAIGTHRILQEDVKFKDLGLIIVDEEQRFGVADKEKLKKLRVNVDVLTLTATPIPRTLHMAMVGLRNISVIETPPEDRYPVQTYVVEEDPDLIREAISREVARGGQVYYLHNRVQTIHRAAEKVQELLPDLSIAVAHGQMNEEELERTMLGFLDGEYDVLVCTTIIESGLDIANVNTLIVEDADNFGLSQLYQLRGRVGRSNRVAYAYFMYRRDKVLHETAEKRLQAISEFTEFGSGLKIALRDLEIRGTGNLLGPEQHGFIASVGFDLYCRLLEEAIREVKGEKPEPTGIDPAIELHLSAYIGDDYISDQGQKIEMYKKIAAISSEEDLRDVQDELMDRFGPLPESVHNLLLVARLRYLARRALVVSINEVRNEILVRAAPGLRLAQEFVDWVNRFPGRRLTLIQGNSPAVKVRTRDLRGELSTADKLNLLQQILEKMT